VLLISLLLAVFANSRFVRADAYSAGAHLNSSALSPIFTPTVQYWGQQLRGWSTEFKLDPNLAATVMQIESCGDPRAVSSAGAQGLFQVMPFHFYAFEDPFDAETNARRGLAYLASVLDRAGGDPRQALAAYNGGPSLIGRAEWTWPAETRRYVKYGAPIYADAQAGLATSESLQAWFDQYGAGLCAQAAQRIGLSY
jgi:soluble lytic murein transglycosylase-like protein